jgi:CO dehydrogenase/acetyl-CoA synthase beta subunit
MKNEPSLIRVITPDELESAKNQIKYSKFAWDEGQSKAMVAFLNDLRKAEKDMERANVAMDDIIFQCTCAVGELIEYLEDEEEVVEEIDDDEEEEDEEDEEEAESSESSEESEGAVEEPISRKKRGHTEIAKSNPAADKKHKHGHPKKRHHKN